VLTMPKPRPVALVGDLVVTQVKLRGAAGMLVDAAVRDVEELAEIGLPIWARYVRVGGVSREQPGQVNAPVAVGGAQISPGDVVVLDADGAVCVQRDRVAKVLRASEARMEKEARLHERLLAGALSYDLHGLREVVEKRGREP
jgi:4-hydroxy-4-methyl-2-oxoglutarate aldolase